MAQLRYKIEFLKRTAKLNKDATKAFAIDILKDFGGLTLLSNLNVSAVCDCEILVTCENEIAKMVHAAFISCGTYQEMKCCFKEILI